MYGTCRSIYSVSQKVLLYPVWIHSCEQPNYDFGISQGSVVTAAVFRRLDNVWRSSTLSLEIKLDLYTSVVVSTAIYASETWKSTARICQQLDVFHQCNLRKMSWTPHGSGRRRCRPTETWRSTFKEDLVDQGLDWNSVWAAATNRSRWQTFAAHCPVKDRRI